MIDLLLKAGDKVIELLKYRHERSRRTYTEIAEPIYTALVDVHSEYLHMFEDTLIALRKGEPLEAIVKDLAKACRANEAVRRGNRAALRDYITNSEGDGTMYEFYVSCDDYFRETSLTCIGGGATPGSMVRGWFIDACAIENERDFSANWLASIRDDLNDLSNPIREILELKVTNTLAVLRAKWEEVSILHARLRKESLCD